MIPFELPVLTMTKGLPFGPVDFYFTNPDQTPKDLTGYSVFADARRFKYDHEKFDLTPVVYDPTGGQVRIVFDQTATAVQTAGDWGWDMVLQNSEGTKSGPYFIGTITIQELNTRG